MVQAVRWVLQLGVGGLLQLLLLAAGVDVREGLGLRGARALQVRGELVLGLDEAREETLDLLGEVVLLRTGPRAILARSSSMRRRSTRDAVRLLLVPRDVALLLELGAPVVLHRARGYSSSARRMSLSSWRTFCGPRPPGPRSEEGQEDAAEPGGGGSALAGSAGGRAPGPAPGSGPGPGAAHAGAVGGDQPLDQGLAHVAGRGPGARNGRRAPPCGRRSRSAGAGSRGSTPRSRTPPGRRRPRSSAARAAPRWGRSRAARAPAAAATSSAVITAPSSTMERMAVWPSTSLATVWERRDSRVPPSRTRTSSVPRAAVHAGSTPPPRGTPAPGTRRPTPAAPSRRSRGRGSFQRRGCGLMAPTLPAGGGAARGVGEAAPAERGEPPSAAGRLAAAARPESPGAEAGGGGGGGAGYEPRPADPRDGGRKPAGLRPPTERGGAGGAPRGPAGAGRARGGARPGAPASTARRRTWRSRLQLEQRDRVLDEGQSRPLRARTSASSASSRSRVLAFPASSRRSVLSTRRSARLTPASWMS